MTHTQHDLAKGALLMSIGFFLMACFGALIKVTASLSSYFFAVWLTFLVATLIQYGIVAHQGWKFFKTQHIVKHFFRAFFGVIATFLYVMALGHLKLMNATLLFNTTPLFVPIIAVIFLKHHVPWKVWIAIAVGFVGIVFIIRPTEEIVENPWDLVGLASGIMLAAAFIMIKLLTATDPMMRVSFYFFFFATLLASFFLPFFWENYSWDVWLWGIATGTASIIAQLFIIKAYQVSDASAVGVFQYISVIVAGFIDWIVWDKVPNFLTYIGTFLIILGGISVILFSKKCHG